MPPPGERGAALSSCSCYLWLFFFFFVFRTVRTRTCSLCLRGSLCVSVCVRNWRGFCLRAFLHLYILKYVPVRRCRLLRAEPSSQLASLHVRTSPSQSSQADLKVCGGAAGVNAARGLIKLTCLHGCKVCRAAEME